MKNPSAAKAIKGRTVVDNLYRAAARYVEAKGGKALVIGGIQVIRVPGEGKYNFKLAVCITGHFDEETMLRK